MLAVFVKLVIFALIPLVLSIGITPVLPYDLVPEVDALKSQGTASGNYGSATKLQVCGAMLCSEYDGGFEQFLEDNNQGLKLYTPTPTLSTPVPETIDDELITSTITLPPYPNQPDVNPDFDAHTANFWPPKIIKVTDQVYSAVGYGLANSIMVIGDDGIIIVDAMMSNESAEEVMNEFRKISTLPVKAVVYTHSHPDHINGAGIFEKYSDGDLEIFAHSTLLDNYYRESGELGPLTVNRGLFYYGALLPTEGPDRIVNVGIGPFLETGETSTSFISPTVTFDDKLETEVAGLKMTLIHVPRMELFWMHSK